MWKLKVSRCWEGGGIIVETAGGQKFCLSALYNFNSLCNWLFSGKFEAIVYSLSNVKIWHFEVWIHFRDRYWHIKEGKRRMRLWTTWFQSKQGRPPRDPEKGAARCGRWVCWSQVHLILHLFWLLFGPQYMRLLWHIFDNPFISWQTLYIFTNPSYLDKSLINWQTLHILTNLW